MPKFQIYLVEWKKYLKEKVKSYTCKESDGVENEVRGGEDDPCVWMWMVVEDPNNWIDQHQNHDHKETSKGDKSDAKAVVVAVVVPVPWAPVACHTVQKQFIHSIQT